MGLRGITTFADSEGLGSGAQGQQPLPTVKVSAVGLRGITTFADSKGLGSGAQGKKKNS